MADAKISALTALTGANVAPDDVLAIVDTSVPETKSITREEFQIYNAGTFTTDKKVLDLSVTWNNAAVTFTADKINVTDTASGANSLLLDRQVGGVSKFSVKKDGAIASYRGAGAYTAEIPFYFSNDNGSATKTFSLYYSGGTGVYFNIGGTRCSHLSPDGFNTTGYYGLNASAGAGVDTILARDAANTFAQRNGTNAQTFRLYNTYTDASNYERGFMRWNSNFLEIGSEAAGTGTVRDIYFKRGTLAGLVMENGRTTSGNSNFAIPNTKHLIFSDGTDWNRGLTSVAGVKGIRLTDGSTGGGSLDFTEMTAPAAPAANSVRIYAQDNGAGKTQLMALFATGAAQQLAIEP